MVADHDRWVCGQCKLLICTRNGCPSCGAPPPSTKRRRTTAEHSSSPAPVPATSQVEPKALLPDHFPNLPQIFSQRFRAVAHIPSSYRRCWGSLLASELLLLLQSPCMDSLHRLFALPRCDLCRPPRAGRSHAKEVGKAFASRLVRWEAGDLVALLNHADSSP